MEWSASIRSTRYWLATSFEDAIRNAISIGDDSGTIAAIAGPVAEALFGISDDMETRAWHYLPEEMRVVLHALYGSAEKMAPARAGIDRAHSVSP